MGFLDPALFWFPLWSLNRRKFVEDVTAFTILWLCFHRGFNWPNKAPAGAFAHVMNLPSVHLGWFVIQGLGNPAYNLI